MTETGRWRRPMALAAVLAALLATPYVVRPDDDHQARELRELEAALARRDAVFDRVVDAVSSQMDLDPDVVTGAGLRPMADLGGSGTPVGHDDRALLDGATVRIGKRHRTSARWAPVCSGVLVDRGGSVALVTVPDCFVNDLAADEGMDEYVEDDGTTWYLDPPSREREISEQLPYVYGILDPTTPVGEATATTTLREIAVYGDWAQGWAVASVVDPAGLLERAIPLDRLLGDGADPEAGQATATRAFPKGRGPAGVASTGTYLGRTQDQLSGDAGLWVDHVAIPQDPGSARDACSAGATGASVVLADGTFLGLLRSRNTLGRGPDHELAPDEWDGRFERLGIEAELELDIPDDVVVCSYTAARWMELDALWPLLDAADREEP